MPENPLGKTVEYPQKYAPEALFPIARAESRSFVPDAENLPFYGADLLTAWDLSWLNRSGKPVVGVATIRLPADSPKLIESKSLKLYLNSLANNHYPDRAAITSIMTGDLSCAADADVEVDIDGMSELLPLARFPGQCIDDLSISAGNSNINPELLSSDASEVVDEALFTHLLRSNCPITDQPDMGSLLVRYSGPRINQKGLLEYVVSYRNHNGFHEACVEQIFVDIKTYCSPDQLTVYARYNRRGGIDINPFRSDFEEVPDNLRLWRQ